MRSVVLCVIGMFLAGPAYSQTGTTAKPSNSGTTAHRPAAQARGSAQAGKGARFKPDIPLSTPIITLNGICGEPGRATTKDPEECKIVVTRGQLDALVDAIDPGASPRTRQQFAINYARLLAASQVAERKRVDQNPNVIREIQFQQKILRMQILTDALVQTVQEKAAHIPEDKVQAYYKQYHQSFAQADVSRLAIPLNAPTESGKAIDPAAAKILMEELRDRVLAGDEFEQLQARAYKTLGIKSPVPVTDISMMNRPGMTPDEAKVFEMDLGETSPVFEDQNVLVILRVRERKVVPIDQARGQIEAMLLHEETLEALRGTTEGITAEFNLKYLETQSQPDLFPPSMVSQAPKRRSALLASGLGQP
jgi:hypothetical protein